MAAYTSIDLVINQKDSFLASFTVKNTAGTVVNLTNYTASAAMKQDYTSADSSAIYFTTNITDAANGVITIALSPTQTTALQLGVKYVYDVSIISPTDGFKTRIVQGMVKVSGGVS